MKLKLVLIVASTSMCIACKDASSSTQRAAAPNTTSAIFREISIEPYGRLALDSSFAQSGSDIAKRIGASDFALVSLLGRLANTDSIIVTVDTTNRVQLMRFVYVTGTDFYAAATDYETSLNKPQIMSDTSVAGVRTIRMGWKDAATFFELVLTQSDGHARVHSILRNVSDADGRAVR